MVGECAPEPDRYLVCVEDRILATTTAATPTWSRRRVAREDDRAVLREGRRQVFPVAAMADYQGHNL
jgi:hypothetical protein